MTTLHRVLMCLIAIAVVVTGLQLVKAQTAAAEAHRAEQHLTSVRHQVEAIEHLQSQIPGWAQRTGAGLGHGGLATAVDNVLASAGVPASALVSLSPAAETPITIGGGGDSRAGNLAGFAACRRRAVLTLAPLTLPQVGAVLQTWREAHPDWTIASIDITPEPSGRKDTPLAAGTDLPLRAVISIETLYVSASKLGRGVRN
jgi:hypothetical protein